MKVAMHRFVFKLKAERLEIRIRASAYRNRHPLALRLPDLYVRVP